MSQTSTLELVLRRERWVIAGCLASVVILAWAYIVAGAGMDMSMPGMVMAPMTWSPATAILMFAMWWIMMIAMMVPSAAPTVLLFSAIGRKQTASGHQAVGAGIFLVGYLAVWAGFSFVATALQWGLELLGLMAMDMKTSSQMLGGIILLAAGVYQFTPIKTVCLRHCQSPVLFLSGHWQSGAAGAFRMGFWHGAYCLGCCWFLMALLFVGGVMNLVWIAVLAVYVALEKLLAGSSWLSRGAGAGLALAGVWTLTKGF
jgi:predicted metal-binding membrane protein